MGERGTSKSLKRADLCRAGERAEFDCGSTRPRSELIDADDNWFLYSFGGRAHRHRRWELYRSCTRAHRRFAGGVAVGTAFVFTGVLRLIAAPFYLAGNHIHSRYLWLLVQGAVPGLLIGTYALQLLSSRAGSPIVIIVLGILLTVSSSFTFVPRAQNRGFAHKNVRWLPVLAFPIGVEAGFSSEGAGVLGTVLLLNYSEMTPLQVVGTDLLFGFVLAVIGSAFHLSFGSITTPSSSNCSPAEYPESWPDACLLANYRHGSLSSHHADRALRGTSAHLDRHRHA